MITIVPKYVKVLPSAGGFILYVGPWACRFNTRGDGRFANGSRWFSGWCRWKEEILL